MGRELVERNRHRGALDGDDGMSLIEMMVAILILGVILSAFAGSLISFSKMSLVNERRVQATAQLTRLHEQLQTIPWDQAAVYDDEIDQLDAMGVDRSTDPPTLDGDPLVLLPAPDNSACPSGDPDCARDAFVPRTSHTIDLDDRSYEVYQAVAWDQTAPQASSVKRFSTLVRWRIGEQEYEQRIESTRAVTVAESGEGVLPEIRSLLVSPDTIQLDEDGRSETAIGIDLEFDRGIDAAGVEYVILTEDGPETRTLDLGVLDVEDTKPISFQGSIPAGLRFAPGQQALQFLGVDGTDLISGTRNVTFVAHTGDEDDDGGTGSGQEPEITQIMVSRLTVLVGDKGQDSGRFCDDLVLTAQADGVTSGDVPGVVTAYYRDDTSTGTAMQVIGAIDGTNDTFRRSWSAGSESPWRPARRQNDKKPAVDVTDRLRVIVQNPDGRSSNIAVSDQVTFTTTSDGTCP